MSYPPGANEDSRAPSNIIVVDGHTYTWEWDADNLVLSSGERGIVFMMAALDFANDTRSRYEQELHRWYKFRGGSIPYMDDDTIWAEQNDPDLIEDYVNRYKETATVINNYED